jgi:hypothetical protein
MNIDDHPANRLVRRLLLPLFAESLTTFGNPFETGQRFAPRGPETTRRFLVEVP